MTTPSILPLRRHIAEQYIEQLIALLDQLDDDPDLEPSLASFGGSSDDREEDTADFEDGGDAEPEEIEENGDEQDFIGIRFMGGSAP